VANISVEFVHHFMFGDTSYHWAEHSPVCKGVITLGL